MAYNTKYGLKYPGGEDYYNVEDFNKNFSTVADNLDKVDSLAKGKANASHTHKAEDVITGVLPVNRGGTGGTTASTARKNLELGTAAQKNVADNIDSSDTNLITSKAVSDSLKKKQGKFCYVVAASDSDEKMKLYADYVCSGTYDYKVIQKAIDEAPEGSEIKLLAGHYNLYNPISIDKQIMLIGSGINTVLTSTRTVNSKLLLMHCIYINHDSGENLTGVEISNMQISRGLSCINGSYCDGTGIKFTEEFPASDYRNTLISIGNVDKLNISDIYFKNKYQDGNINMVCFNNTPNLTSITCSNINFYRCYHTIGNADFNGYFLSFYELNATKEINNLTVNIVNCEGTNGLHINLNSANQKDKFVVLNREIKFYVNNTEIEEV